MTSDQLLPMVFIFATVLVILLQGIKIDRLKVTVDTLRSLERRRIRRGQVRRRQRAVSNSPVISTGPDPVDDGDNPHWYCKGSEEPKVGHLVRPLDSAEPWRPVMEVRPNGQLVDCFGNVAWPAQLERFIPAKVPESAAVPALKPQPTDPIDVATHKLTGAQAREVPIMPPTAPIVAAPQPESPGVPAGFGILLLNGSIYQDLAFNSDDDAAPTVADIQAKGFAVNGIVPVIKKANGELVRA